MPFVKIHSLLLLGKLNWLCKAFKSINRGELKRYCCERSRDSHALEDSSFSHFTEYWQACSSFGTSNGLWLFKQNFLALTSGFIRRLLYRLSLYYRSPSPALLPSYWSIVPYKMSHGAFSKHKIWLAWVMGLLWLPVEIHYSAIHLFI